jgi:hypothetical protein
MDKPNIQISKPSIGEDEWRAANKFGSLKNVTTLVHDAGHIYPVKEIQVFLKKYLFNL